jgi:hypothetical protein
LPSGIARRLRILLSALRCEDIRWRRTVWSAAVRREKRERMMPQYHEVRTCHASCWPCVILGQEPVEVRTPARRAA